MSGLTQLVSNVLGDVIREPFTLIGCIGAMIYLDWKLSVIALVVFPVCILPIALLGRKIRKASKSGQESLGDRVCFITLEFGTYPVEQMFEVLRRDHLLHRQPIKWQDRQVQKVKQALRKHFYPASADWQEMVLFRGRQVIRQAMHGLLEVS